MTNNLIMDKDQIIQSPMGLKPHVVLLGAGASLASFPYGDANGNRLPVMNNLIEIVHLEEILKKYHHNPSGNFEKIYSELNSPQALSEIEDKIFQYFNVLRLPTSVTIYDKLLLSLRRKDAIFTFNWDPFLFDAYQRNYNIAPLPHIFFLHGNVRVGACTTCDNWGRKLAQCSNCNTTYGDVPLLYPVEKKKYFENNQYTSMSWKSANCWFANAFTITIFGYSAPTSDQEAVDLLKKAWFQKSRRQFEHVEIIDILTPEEISKRWSSFTPTHHLTSVSTFENSRIWKSPRRSCEALFYPMSQGIPCETFPLTETDDLGALQKAINQISQYEDH